MAKAPRPAELLSIAARSFAAGDPQRAAALCRDALRMNGDDARALHLLAACQTALGEAEGAESTLARAVRLAPREPDLLVAHAGALIRLGRVDEALTQVDLALAIRPDDDRALACKADALFRRGDIDEADRLLAPRLESGAAGLHTALALASLCPRKGRHEQVAALLRRLLDDASIPPAQAMRARFALGDVLDDAGQFDEAFAEYAAANALKAPRPDAAAYETSLESMLRAWTPEAVAALPRAAFETDLPVFIVGMPRSGTSLVEQILASHPAVYGAGERKDLNKLVGELQFGRENPAYHLHHLDALSRRVVDRSARRVADAFRAESPRAERVTDKNPVNYLHLGLISVLFPRARVIHCVRDPLDTALSCYFNNIVGVHAFADTLPAVGRWHRSHDRVMRHWASILDLDLLEVRYEDLVADPERHTRRLVDHLGLPWEPACLRFHENRRMVFTPSVDQVRRPVYAGSVGRWRNYERHLGPLKQALESS